MVAATDRIAIITINNLKGLGGSPSAGDYLEKANCMHQMSIANSKISRGRKVYSTAVRS